MKHPGSKKEYGQALAEFALVLPIILLLFMGIIDFGRLMFMYSQLSNAVREGARYGSVTGPTPTTPQFANCTGITNAVKNTLAIPIASNDLTISVAYDDGKNDLGMTCAGTGPSSGAIDLGDRIKVTATAKFYLITPFVSRYGPIDITLTSARTILKGGTQVGDSDE